MPVCKNLEWKYLREYEGGIQVVINREGTVINKKFSFRKNGGYTGAHTAALNYRDMKHKELFGAPVTKRYFHLSPRNGSTKKDPTFGFELPAGISVTYIKDSPFYIVAAWSPESNRVLRKRFSINKIGSPKEALKQAIEFRIQKLIDIDRS